jgi:PAS domain S-box-containing protein
LEELFRALYEETARVMEATVFFFALYDEASQTVEVVRQMDRGAEYPGGAFPLGRGFTSDVIRTGEPRLVRRWSTEGPSVHLLYGTEAGELVAPQSGVVVPIVSGDGVLGVLSTQSYRPDAYDDADVFSLRAIAAQAGLTIKRLRATEQMALERERHALELEAILAGMNDALLTVDERGGIVRINRAARELLGLDSASLVFGQPLDRQRLEQWPATAREVAAALAPVIDALRSGTSVAGVEVELRSGQRRVLSFSGSVLRPPKGALQGGVIVFRDVTGQRELEQLRDDMFAMASHDLRTPITVIRGQAEVLLKRLASGERNIPAFKAAASSIVSHADRVTDLLTLLLDISCLEAGVLSISRSPMNLGGLVHEVTESIRSSAKHPIQVSADESVVGEWDERRIRQVLMNLLSNALKYSPEGSTVTVSVAKDESSATVRVRDEGIGLDGEELAQLFRRGYRAESAQHLPGAGLGLYFGHGIIAAHGGRVWAESLGHGQGSTFCFTLPMQEEPNAVRPVEPPA